MKQDNIRQGNREWSKYLYQRLKALIHPLEQDIDDIEHAGYQANVIEKISFNGANVPPDSQKRVSLTESDPTVPAWAKASSKPSYTAGEVGAIPATDKGNAGGVAELDSGGKVPSSQLPSYVDDVLEYASVSAFPATGESGKIYVALDTNLTYRWTGSEYVNISQSLALGETSSTAYRGDRGKAAYDHAQAKGSAFASGLYKITTNAEGHVTAVELVVKGDLTALGVASADDLDILKNALNYAVMTGQAVVREMSKNTFTTAEKNKLAGIETGAQVNSITGVKGNAESDYRTGNVNITKANIGLGNVDNTSDAGKPISTAQQAAFDGVDRDAMIDRVAFNYAYTIMQAELRDVQKRLAAAGL